MANKIYTALEAGVSFKPSSGTVVFTPQNKATGTGRVSQVLDLGAGARASTFDYMGFCKPGSAPTVGAMVRQYLIASNDNAHWPTGWSNAAEVDLTSEDSLRNATALRPIEADAAAAQEFVVYGSIVIRARYVRVAWWNALAVTLTNTAADHEFWLYPRPSEVQ